MRLDGATFRDKNFCQGTGRAGTSEIQNGTGRNSQNSGMGHRTQRDRTEKDVLKQEKDALKQKRTF